ncbi:MAG: RuvX/YqgF family protein [Fervidobacterium sp.]
MSIIAIDYGKSKCGYAVGNVFVKESGTVKTQELFERIKSFQKIILGLPLSMSGNYSTQTFEVIKFGLKLLTNGKDVYLLDERLTTKMAKTYQKKDDDRFSAEQLLLEYIESPNRAKELIKSKVKQPYEIRADFAIFVEVPYDENFSVSSAIAYSKDAYLAYTLFSKGFFVYRVFKDFLSALENLEKEPDYIIMNNECREKMSILEKVESITNVTVCEFSLENF